MPKINKTAVDGAKPDKERGRYFVWDTELRGFGLLVLPTGVKSYLYQYRTPEGRTRRATIGKHGTFTAEEARAKADAMRQAVNKGGDPLNEKRERRDAKTVADVLDAYIESEAFTNKALKTRDTDKGRINRHLKPLLGTKHVDALTPEAVKRAFAAIRDGKTAKTEKTGPRGLSRVRGGEGAARKTIRLLRTALEWAGPRGEKLVATNAAADVSVGTDGRRDAILEDSGSYARLFQTLDRMQVERRVAAPVADAIRVIALTGARRGEIAGVQWKHVNLKTGEIVLPPARHKTGGKTGDDRRISLPAIAQAIIAKQKAGKSDDYVFPPAHGDGPVNLSKPWRTIRVEAELPEGIGLHGLRHTVASHLAMSGAQASEIMTALGHRNLATSQKYIHWAQDARQTIAERAAAVALAGMTEAKGTEAVENVVPLKGGA